MLFGTQRINDRGHLEVGGCDTVALAERYGTPLYVYDEAALRARAAEYREAFESSSPGAVVAYATKAFLCRAMARLVHEAGLHLDVASLGELRTVLAADVPPEKVTLHGNYKKDEDLLEGLERGVGRVAIDSRDEALRLSALASERQLSQPCLLRVAPGIDPHTLDAISTGRNDTKFGVTVENGAAAAVLAECLALEGIRLVGLHAHVGSQILTVDTFRLLATRMMDFAAEARAAHGWTPEILVLGGGLGIRYSDRERPPPVKALAETIGSVMEAEARRRELPVPQVGVEPGRSIAGEYGLTLYRVGPVKTVPAEGGGARTYTVVDGGLSDNPRPVMYGATYPVVMANRASEAHDTLVRVSGRHCETDTLLDATRLPSPRSGDLLAVLSTGAYNHSMASNYNLFYRPPVVFVESGRSRVVVRAETQDDLLARDVG